MSATIYNIEVLKAIVHKELFLMCSGFFYCHKEESNMAKRNENKVYGTPEEMERYIKLHENGTTQVVVVPECELLIGNLGSGDSL